MGVCVYLRPPSIVSQTEFCASGRCETKGGKAETTREEEASQFAALRRRVSYEYRGAHLALDATVRTAQRSAAPLLMERMERVEQEADEGRRGRAHERLGYRTECAWNGERLGLLFEEVRSRKLLGPAASDVGVLAPQ